MDVGVYKARSFLRLRNAFLVISSCFRDIVINCCGYYFSFYNSYFAILQSKFLKATFRAASGGIATKTS